MGGRGFIIFAFLFFFSGNARSDSLQSFTWFLKGYPRWGTCEQAQARVKVDFERAVGPAAKNVSVECWDWARQPTYLPAPYPPPYAISIRYQATSEIQLVSTNTLGDGYRPESEFIFAVRGGYRSDEDCIQDLFGPQFPIYRPSWKAALAGPGAPIINFGDPNIRDPSDRAQSGYPPDWNLVVNPAAPFSQVKLFFEQMKRLPAAAFCYPSATPTDESHPWMMRIDTFLPEEGDIDAIRPFQFYEEIPQDGAAAQVELQRRVKALRARGIAVGRNYVGHDFLMMRSYLSILYYGTAEYEFQER
jgi:hypothetical protein